MLFQCRQGHGSLHVPTAEFTTVVHQNAHFMRCYHTWHRRKKTCGHGGLKSTGWNEVKQFSLRAVLIRIFYMLTCILTSQKAEMLCSISCLLDNKGIIIIILFLLLLCTTPHRTNVLGHVLRESWASFTSTQRSLRKMFFKQKEKYPVNSYGQSKRIFRYVKYTEKLSFKIHRMGYEGH